MQVETYECVETASEPIEATAEAIALMEELELDGQKQLVSPAESKSGGGSRCPYREITSEERFVYRTMCPVSINIARYNAAPIPLRVLRIASHANSLGLFKRLMIWDHETVTVKAPVLVAFTGGEYEWIDNRCFILARWGEELETFATLLKRAVISARERLTNEAESLVKIVQATTDAQIIAAGADKKIVWE